MTVICDLVGQQSNLMYGKGRQPVHILFSDKGYHMALYQDRSNCFSNPTNPPTKLTYMGLPYSIDRTQAEDVRVLDQQQVEGGVRVTVTDAFASTEKATKDVVLIGRALTAPQLSDIIAAYTEAHPNSDFSCALNDAVRHYGRFE